jgi:hypothetical protein
MIVNCEPVEIMNIYPCQNVHTNTINNYCCTFHTRLKPMLTPLAPHFHSYRNIFEFTPTVPLSVLLPPIIRSPSTGSLAPQHNNTNLLVIAQEWERPTEIRMYLTLLATGGVACPLTLDPQHWILEPEPFRPANVWRWSFTNAHRCRPPTAMDRYCVLLPSALMDTNCGGTTPKHRNRLSTVRMPHVKSPNDDNDSNDRSSAGLVHPATCSCPQHSTVELCNTPHVCRRPGTKARNRNCLVCCTAYPKPAGDSASSDT